MVKRIISRAGDTVTCLVDGLGEVDSIGDVDVRRIDPTAPQSGACGGDVGYFRRQIWLLSLMSMLWDGYKSD